MQITIFISMSNVWTATLARSPGPFVSGAKNTTVHNGHLSTTATPLQRPVFLADSPYIHSCLNLSTMATFFCPQRGRCCFLM